MKHARIAQLAFVSLALVAGSAPAAVIFNNDFSNDQVGMLTRPGNGVVTEVEAADDFSLTSNTRLTGATFTGLIPLGGAGVKTVRVEIYKIFPADSGPFDNKVPTRVNSPADVAFKERDNAGTGGLSFTTNTGLNNQALNSVLNKDIVFPPQPPTPPNSNPNGGSGKHLGQQLQIVASFSVPIDLAAGHYFFVPQVELTNGDFLWLSGPRPAHTAIDPTDLQAWIRNDPGINPDWERVGTDIIGDKDKNGGTITYNGAFSLEGTVVPEESTVAMLIAGLLAVGSWSQRKRA